MRCRADSNYDSAVEHYSTAITRGADSLPHSRRVKCAPAAAAHTPAAAAAAATFAAASAAAAAVAFAAGASCAAAAACVADL